MQTAKSFEEVSRIIVTSGKTQKKILLADDDVSFCVLLKQILVEQGYNVEAVNNGEDAIVKFFEYLPDLVILDFRMPKLGGVEVFRKIREKDKDIPVIFVTGLADTHEIEQALDYGWSTILKKPIDLDEFCVLIRRLGWR